MEYAIDLDMGIVWVLNHPHFLNSLDVKPNAFNHWQIGPEHLSTELLTLLASHNLMVYYSEIFYTHPHDKIIIHADAVTPPDSCKLNWVYELEPTEMRWFNITDGQQLKCKNNLIGGQYYTIDDESKYELVYTHKMQKPTMVNVSVPHDVVNNTDYPRWCVSVVVKDAADHHRISWSKLKERLERYIIK